MTKIKDYNKSWFFFGAYKQPGHRVYLPDGRSTGYTNLEKFDGKLVSSGKPEFKAYLRRFSDIGYSALAFVDYRGG